MLARETLGFLVNRVASIVYVLTRSHEPLPQGPQKLVHFFSHLPGWGQSYRLRADEQVTVVKHSVSATHSSRNLLFVPEL